MPSPSPQYRHYELILISESPPKLCEIVIYLGNPGLIGAPGKIRIKSESVAVQRVCTGPLGFSAFKRQVLFDMCFCG